MALAFEKPKDPDEVLDYQVDWSARILTDTIETSEWIDVTEGITVDSDEFTDTTTTIWVSGGEAGNVYLLTNRITTAGGRTMDQTVKIKVKER